MEKEKSLLDIKVLNEQTKQWEKSFTKRKDMFGADASEPARKAVEIFKNNGVKNILELGGGQGRDTLFFARSGFEVTVLDYCESGVLAISEKAEKNGLVDLVHPMCHDVRQRFPFADETFDDCYSHMLYCMALSTSELEFLSAQVRRMLKPGGLNVYTVRHKGDAHFRQGIHRGEDMYETGGYIVHFFDEEKVKHLATGYEIIAIDKFEEGGLPRKLFRVTLRKKVKVELNDEHI